LSDNVKGVLVVEMNAGQMVEDVRLSINNNIPIEFYGRMGGMIPQPDEIVQKIKDLSKLAKI
ncbi:MAG: 3-methyl-2-oxobutanoate dehydrogenase subunit beta, partial [Candidatus Neomarinimicrobiota bacterium]